MILQIWKRKMALAGIMMTLFLLIHMLLNLQFFEPEAFNAFYRTYHDSLIRWPVLISIVIMLGFHVTAAFRIRRQNARARNRDYQKQAAFKIPAFLVSVSITFLLFFIMVHIIQTLLFASNDIYQETLALFSSVWMALFYLAGLAVLMLHLQHSLANVLQTLGKSAHHYHWAAMLFALFVTGGFAIVPLYIVIVG